MLSKLKRNNKKGFTLIELMIVVAIIGIMAAIAIPNFLNYMCKSKQSEAKVGLGTLATGQESYYVEYDSYTSSLTRAASSPTMKGKNPRYVFSIATGDVSATQFTAIATGTIKQTTADDYWTIQQSRILSNTTNGCGG